MLIAATDAGLLVLSMGSRSARGPATLAQFCLRTAWLCCGSTIHTL